MTNKDRWGAPPCIIPNDAARSFVERFADWGGDSGAEKPWETMGSRRGPTGELRIAGTLEDLFLRFPKTWGYPKNRLFIVESRVKMDDLGVTIF